VIDGDDDTQGWNRFSYCRNNPILYKDPTGNRALGEWMHDVVGISRIALVEIPFPKGKPRGQSLTFLLHAFLKANTQKYLTLFYI
jgi:hypothetical protein